MEAEGVEEGDGVGLMGGFGGGEVVKASNCGVYGVVKGCKSIRGLGNW